MNFEFKSTFNQDSVRSGVRRRIRSMREHHAFWIAFVNINASTILLSLYFENILIPATYACGTFADYLIYMFEPLLVVWIITTLYGVVRTLYDYALSEQRKSAIGRAFQPILEFIQVIVLHTLIQFNVRVTKPIRSHTTRLNPTTHINFILTA
jgi:hypothetical protein